ncbi:MAG TPA: DUF971 domain-containing protein [Pirellulales bacterium]|nr:DUF971 domain-containing protein [Pirellulales bacterium]
MNAYPTKLGLRADGRLQIDWSDRMVRAYSIAELRERCPCATCREKRSAPPPAATMLPILSAAETRPLTLAGMNPVGHYAYAIAFSDGHDSGIYTFELLRELGALESDAPPD